MDAGKEGPAEDPGPGTEGDRQSTGQELTDAISIWQTNVLKIGITLIVILLSAIWFCWNRIQEQFT